MNLPIVTQSLTCHSERSEESPPITLNDKGDETKLRHQKTPLRSFTRRRGVLVDLISDP